MNRQCRFVPLLLLAIAACQPRSTAVPPAPSAEPGATVVVRDTVIQSSLEVSGIAAPLRDATLGTTLMGSVTEVLVHEGQRVHAGDILARLDARDVNAKGAQAAAGVAQAEAAYDNAQLHVTRIRALYADSAAPKAQLDDAVAALARAEAGVQAARGAVAEVDAARAYADVRAPFDGTVTKRFVDPGSFITMGAPLIAIEDASRLRLSVTVTPSDARSITPGMRLEARIENQPALAIVEGVVPAPGSALFTVNAVIENGGERFLAGSSGTLLLPRANHTGILLPEAALVHDGDLTGTRVRAPNGTLELRWLQVSRVDTSHVEVLSGLRSGEAVALGTSTSRAH